MVARSLLGTFDDPPTPAVLSGSNFDRPVLTFPNSGSDDVYHMHRMPTDWYVPGGLAARIEWCTPATSGNMRWAFYTAFAMPIDGDQDDLDAAYNTLDEVVTPASSTVNGFQQSVFTSLNLTGARPGAMLLFVLERESGHASDTLADDAHLIGLELIYQRRIVLP